LESRSAEIGSQGFDLVAISVDDPATNLKLAARLDVHFPLLSDTSGAAADAFGVWDPDTEISLAATIVVARGGTIIYRMIGANKADRPEIDDVLRVIHNSQATPK